MSDSVLSPMQSVPKYALGENTAPEVSSAWKGTNKSATFLEKSRSPEEADDKENESKPSEKSLKIETTGEISALLDDQGEVESATTPSPKRAAEENVEISPESNSKKSRTDDSCAVESTDNPGTKQASPPKTSFTSKSVDGLLADLAKAKAALQKSKETITLIKEHQQNLAKKGLDMQCRVETFHNLLTKLKDSHAENGRELEKVRESFKASQHTFAAAEETLRKVTERCSKESPSAVINNSKDGTKPGLEAAAINEPTVSFIDGDEKAVDEMETMTENVVDAEENCSATDGKIYMKEEEVEEGLTTGNPKPEFENAETAVEGLASPSRTDQEEDIDEDLMSLKPDAPLTEPVVNNLPSCTITVQEVAPAESFETEEEANTAFEMSYEINAGADSTEVEVKQTISSTQTIDDALFLELQTGDGVDSDDDDLLT